jgi:Fe-S-cluster-containing dehydrogenase component
MSFTDENNPGVLIDLDKCTGCLNCQLICSFTYHEIFNPSLARIRVERTIDDEKKTSFTDECIRCSLCVDYCVYGALTNVEAD